MGDPLIQTLTQSERNNHGLISGDSKVSNIAKLKHALREPLRTVDMVPGLAYDMLLNGSKLADAD